MSDLDLKTFSRDLSPDSPEYHALTLMTVPFPWSREVYALLCDRLLAAGARAVIFDIVFDSARPGDDAFQDVIRRFPDRIVLGMDFKSETIGPGREATSWTIPNTSIIPDCFGGASVGWLCHFLAGVQRRDSQRAIPGHLGTIEGRSTAPGRKTRRLPPSPCEPR